MNEHEAAELAKSMAAECIAVRVRLLSRVITKLYDHNLRTLGIKANQGIMLVAVASRGQIAQTEIGKALQMEKSTVSRNIERMLGRGWLELMPPAEGQLQTLKVSAKGLEMLEKVHRQWQISQKQALELIGGDNIAGIKKLTNPLFKKSR